MKRHLDTFEEFLNHHSLARAPEITPDAIRRAMIYASTLASFCVEAVSLDRLRDLSLGAIAGRFRAFYDLTHFEHLDL